MMMPGGPFPFMPPFTDPRAFAAMAAMMAAANKAQLAAAPPAAHSIDTTGSSPAAVDPSRTRCRFFPRCTKPPGACPYVHPNVPCKYGAKCAYGKQCLYLHPEDGTGRVSVRFVCSGVAILPRIVSMIV